MSAAENKKTRAGSIRGLGKWGWHGLLQPVSGQCQLDSDGNLPYFRDLRRPRTINRGCPQAARAKLAGPPTPAVLNLIAEGDTVVIQWMGKGTTKTGQLYNNSYCYVVQIENSSIIRGTAYLDTELVRAIW